MAPRRGNPALLRGIGERIRLLREDAGRTQESVAWACNVSKALVSRIESGQNLPSLPTLVLIAESLGVHAADIVAFEMRDPRARLLDCARRRDRDGVAAALRALKVQGAPELERPAVLRVAEGGRRPPDAEAKRYRRR